MTDPINVQLNIMQGQDLARVTQQQKDVSVHQSISQEMNRSKESEEKPHQIEESDHPEEAKLNKDGSGRGRSFLRQQKENKEETEEEEEKLREPEKGSKIDVLR